MDIKTYLLPCDAFSGTVVVRVNSGNVSFDVRTDVKCGMADWDGESGRVKYSDSLHIFKNGEIDAQVRRVAGQIQNCIDKYVTANLGRICSQLCGEGDAVPAATEKITLHALVEEKMSTVTALNTRRGYRSLLKYVDAAYGKELDVSAIDKNFVSAFQKRVKEDYPGCNATRLLMSMRMNAVLNHAKTQGYIPGDFCYKFAKIHLNLSDRNIPQGAIRKLFARYRELADADRNFKRPETFSLGIFILNIAFQGLAPVDMASLKICQLKHMAVTDHGTATVNPATPTDAGECTNSIDSIIIRTSRQKTGVPVTIVAAYAPIEGIMSHLLKGKTDDDYLLPCFDTGKPLDPEQRQNRLGNYFNKLANSLNKALEGVFSETDFGEKRRITYYYARHAFCNLVDGMDIPRHIIQLMIGHRSTVLENSYLRKPTLWEQAMISQKILAPLLPSSALPLQPSPKTDLR